MDQQSAIPLFTLRAASQDTVGADPDEKLDASEMYIGDDAGRTLLWGKCCGHHLRDRQMTPTDIHLGRIFYAVLIEHARSRPGKPIRYKELLSLAQRDHPSDPSVASAIPVSLGRRLEVIVQFVRRHDLPPLTSLVVNESGRPGSSYKTVFGSWEADMRAVAEHDWAGWADRWDMHVREATEALAKRRALAIPKRRTEDQALKIIHEAYVSGSIPKLLLPVKQELVQLLIDGLSLESAVAQLRSAGEIE